MADSNDPPWKPVDGSAGSTSYSARADRTVNGNAIWNSSRFAPCYLVPWYHARKGASMTRQLTAVIEREGDGFVALCPQVDIASQGRTVDEARTNLREALELFFETASQTEIEERFRGEVYVTQVEVAVG